MRGFVLALMLWLGVISPSFSQTADETYVERRLDGEELSDIFVAWTAVEREFRPSAPLADFYVHYSTRGGSVTVWFFKPNTVTRTESGDVVIRQDLLSYRAVIENGAVRVVVD
jgi:hypothetical protein